MTPQEPNRNPLRDPRAGDVFLRPSLRARGQPIRVKVEYTDGLSVTFSVSGGKESTSKYSFLDYISGSQVVVA